MRSESGLGLTHNLLRILGQSIVSGTYDTKSFPTEAELSATYGASRTVTREAVKMLTAKGLLTSRPRKGTQVEPMERWNLLDPSVTGWMMERPYSDKIYRDFTQMRTAVEPTAAALAARRQDRAQIRMIREALERMRVSTESNESGLEADIDFHVAILRASGNAFFWQMRELIRVALNMSITLTNKIKGHTADVNAHEAVLIAIEAGDTKAAEAAMETILNEAFELIERHNL
jgi:DNA-binding FadR family transcriptional regulator